VAVGCLKVHGHASTVRVKGVDWCCLQVHEWCYNKADQGIVEGGTGDCGQMKGSVCNKVD
jgi:hypothetical protein